MLVLFSCFKDKAANQMREGTMTSSVLCFCLVWLFRDKKTHVIYYQWNGLTLTICSCNDIPINRNFCQLMLKSLFSVIYWELLGRCFRYVAKHSKINREECWSISCKYNICQSQGKNILQWRFLVLFKIGDGLCWIFP